MLPRSVYIVMTKILMSEMFLIMHMDSNVCTFIPTTILISRLDSVLFSI